MPPHARCLVGLAACPDERDATVRAHRTARCRRSGLPWRILSDNGPPWGTPHPPQALPALSIWLLRLGVGVSHGRPHHPQTQGKVERCHRTRKAERLRPSADHDLAEGQAAFAAWRETDNLERPHHALELDTPASRSRPSPRPCPEALPPVAYGPGELVRTVHRGGQISDRGRWSFVSQALRGQDVARRPTPTDGVLAAFCCHHQLGELDLRRADAALRPPAPAKG